jgi:hypothetical protein
MIIATLSILSGMLIGVGLLYLWDHFSGPVCECGTPLCDHRSEGYTRAYNDLCRQAAGASGSWCPSCNKVVFDEPDFDTWLATQPVWVIPYSEVKYLDARNTWREASK